MKTIGFFAPFSARSSVLLIACFGLVALVSCAGRESSTSPVQSMPSQEAKNNTAEKAAPSYSRLADIPSQPQISAEPTEEPTPAPTEIAVGIPYAEARALLIQQGWIPNEAPEPGPYGVERMLYDSGIREVSACSGTGVGYCAFGFHRLDRDPATGDNHLGVTTTGGSTPVLSDWGTHYVAATPTDPSTNTEGSLTEQAVIPTQFQGEWNYDLEQCSVGYSEGRLVIESTRLDFYESSGTVLEITMQGNSEMTLTTELSSEGTTFTDSRTFQLSYDRSALTDLAHGGVRYRCPDS